MIEKFVHNKKIEYFAEITSTNTVLKNRATNGESENTILISEYQTAGRGRLGKSFFSPRGCGVYLSYLIKPHIKAADAVFITVAAAVAMVRAIDNILGIKTQIKWVNDIYYQDKKLCGILTEGGISSSGNLDFAILGVGLNIKNPPGGYPEEFDYKTTNIENISGEITEDTKWCLIAEFINEFDDIFKASPKDFIKEYRKYSCIIGRKIEILSGDHKGYAKVLDINDNAELVAELPTGEKATLSSGDVSICFS